MKWEAETRMSWNAGTFSHTTIVALNYCRVFQPITKSRFLSRGRKAKFGGTKSVLVPPKMFSFDLQIQGV